MRIVAAITGASGSVYGLRFLARALERGMEIDLVVSNAGARVFRDELGFEPDPRSDAFTAALASAGGAGAVARLRRIPVGDVGAECASGSTPFDGMAVIPCSMGTAARIAAGSASNLIERAADVTLKERRTLALVPRETPLNRIHLDNLLRLHDAGAVVVPAMPAFYGRPQTLEEAVDTVVDRVLACFLGPDVIRSRWTPPRGGPA